MRSRRSDQTVNFALLRSELGLMVSTDFADASEGSGGGCRGGFDLGLVVVGELGLDEGWRSYCREAQGGVWLRGKVVRHLVV